MREATVFKQVLIAQWLWARLALVVLAVLGFAVPLVSVFYGANLDGAAHGRVGEWLMAADRIAQVLPYLALLVGVLVGVLTWTPDIAGRHVYALTLPVPRAYFVTLRFAAGAVLLLIPAVALALGASIASLAVTLPPGIHAHPLEVAGRFWLAALTVVRHHLRHLEFVAPRSDRADQHHRRRRAGGHPPPHAERELLRDRRGVRPPHQLAGPPEHPRGAVGALRCVTSAAARPSWCSPLRCPPQASAPRCRRAPQSGNGRCSRGRTRSSRNWRPAGRSSRRRSASRLVGGSPSRAGWRWWSPGRCRSPKRSTPSTGARVVLGAFGGVPEAFGRSVVVVFQDATDTGLALRADAVRDRRRVPVTGIVQSVSGPRWSVNGLLIAGIIARAYRASLDPDWREWLPWDYGFGPWTRETAWAAFWALTRSPWAASASCLAAAPAGCRLWLGVDRDTAPYEARFSAGELRQTIVEAVRWSAERVESGRSCLDGADAACYAFVRETRFASAYPADETGRRSLIRAVQVLHGPPAVARALADTTGSIGERLARASGIGEDSLMLEWRYWVLTRGGRPADRNLLADGVPAVLLAGLLLAAARRSRG